MRRIVTMEAKKLSTDSTLVAAINDGNTGFDQNSITLLSNRNKSYQNIETNSLGKVEAQTSRPCAIIGPDRVQTSPASGDTFLKKASVEPWPCSDTVHQLQADITHKLPDYQLMQNISPRQTFQENMQRIMVPPSYHSKNIDDNILKSSKVDMPLEVKYCDVPYSINPIVNSEKSIRSSDVPTTVANSPYLPVHHGWPGAGLRPQRPYVPEFYQYPEVVNFTGQRPLQRVHRPPQEDPTQGHPDRFYNETSVRFKPYPSTRERYPQHRYDYVSNYPNTYQLPFPPQKYDVTKTLPSHPYPMYPQVPIRRVPDTIIDPYQRPNQPNFNPYQNQFIPHSYGPVQGNNIPSKMYPYPPDISPNTMTPSKLPYDVNRKLYVDYDSVRNKMYSSVDNMTFLNDPKRQHALKSDVTLTMHPGMNMHHITHHHMYRKDNMRIKPMESSHPNAYAHHLHYSSLAKSPAEYSRIDSIQSIGGLQEDCGYVSQSSSASSRSIDSGNFKVQNEFYRKTDTFFGNGSRTNQNQSSNTVSSSDKKGLDVRQFLQMWNEGEDEVSDSTIPSTALTTQSDSNPEQLIILGSVTIPNEELSKYEHIQKISKLPENIKGYNSIELLNQYEQLVETPTIQYNRKPYPSPSNLTKKSTLIPRPLSPLDVEAKISQSVIHKEVGCNFEIKPCSPKMMNVEIATPLQNIINERAIEKVINTGVTNSQVLPNRTDIVAVNSPTTSCKMNAAYISNEDIIKNNNYSLQDLEINSGVCLASLPRLDSDIELNFPEINQQFIDANRFKISTTNEDLKINKAQSLFKSENDCDTNDKDINDSIVQTPDLNSIETAKLSKYRKVKPTDAMPNESRTDSVIIKNPDTLRKNEIYNITESPQGNTENTQVDTKSELQNNTIHKDNTCSAIDFSLNKLNESSEINSHPEHLAQTDFKNDDISTKDEDETQMYALSLVTKKVEMELREFEQNKCNMKTEKKHIQPGLSLGMIYEDTTTLPELDPNPKIDIPTPIVSSPLKDNESLSDVDKLIPCNSYNEFNHAVQFECDNANHKDEDIFKDDIVMDALNGPNMISIQNDIKKDTDKNNMEIEKEIFFIQNSNIDESNKNLHETISSDLLTDSYEHNEDKQVELVEEINNGSNNCVQDTDYTFTKIGTSDHLKEIKPRVENTDNLYNCIENSVEKTLQVDNQNVESEAATVESCEYSDENFLYKDTTQSSDHITSAFSIIDGNLDVAQMCNKLSVKEDTNINDKEDSLVTEIKNCETNTLDTSSPDNIYPQTERGVKAKVYVKNDNREKRDIIQENFSKNNVVCTTSVQFPLEHYNDQIDTLSTRLEDSSEISKTKLEKWDPSSNNITIHNNDTISSCNENQLASEEIVRNENEKISETLSCFDNGLLKNTESRDADKYHARIHGFSACKKYFCKRKQYFTKEYFSPWMQKLFIYSSGLCVKSPQVYTEDIKDSKCPTDVDIKATIQKEINDYFVNTTEKKNSDLIFSSTTNCLSQNVIEESFIKNEILSNDFPNNMDPECKQENIGENDGENKEFIKGDDKLTEKCVENLKSNVIFPKRGELKRSLSESAIDLYSDESFNKVSSNKRRRIIIENFIESSRNEQEICELTQSNRRKSISAICNNDNLLIVIDDNEYLIAEEDCESSNVEYAEESSEFLQETENTYAYNVDKELHNGSNLGSSEFNVDNPLTLNDINQDKWLNGDSYIENMFNDDVAVDITISAPVSPENSNLSSNNSICTDNESDHIVRIKEIYGETMCINDMQIVETLYKLPQMNVNKALVDIESHNSLENKMNEIIAPNINIDTPNPTNSPIMLGTNFKNDDDTILENLENRDIESPFKMNDDNDDVINVVSNEKTIEPYELINCRSLPSSDCKYYASSSPEVSSTTSEDKCSGILLKITSVNGSRRSEINNMSENLQQIRYKFTEKNDYNTKYRPLITKAAQKYIPPIIESNDLKVKLPLPQNSLNKLKQLKLAKKEALISTISKNKKAAMTQEVSKKVKPKFEDVLKSIDEIQFKMHKDKFKKNKQSVPKVLIKKHENGAHYASTPVKKSAFNPDLTGRKWQPWVFIEKNEFVDRMAQRNKHKAVYCHRKKTFVLEEKFKKYKSICTAKFVISQPTSDHPSSGNLKYTIRLKHNY